MKRDFYRKIYWLGLFLVICPVFNFLPAYNEIKFVGISILGIMGWLLFQPKLIRLDVFYFIFLGFGMISVLQAQVISLIWQPLFSWIGIIFLAIAYRNTEDYEWLNLGTFFKLSFLGMLFLIGIGTLKGIRGNQAWVDYCGQNVNYASVIPIVLSPVFIFGTFRWRWVHYFHPLIIGILWYFTYYFRSGLGIGLIGLVTILYLFHLLKQVKHQQLLKWSLVAIILVGLVLVGFKLVENIPEFSSGTSVRWQNYQLSWMAFGDHPIIGNGIGNWYFFMQDYIPLLEEPYAHGSPMFSHSFVGRLLSEIGLFGFMSFFIPIIVGLYDSWKGKALLGPFPLLIIILMGTFFTFRPAESNEQTYNEIPLWLFLAVAHLHKQKVGINKRSIPLTWGVLILLSFGVLWSSYWFYSNHQYLRSIQFRKQGLYEKEHEILTRLYHPVFRSIVGSDLFSVEALVSSAKARMPVVIEEAEVIIMENPIKKETRVISQKGVVLKPGFSVSKGKKFSATVVSSD